MKEKDPESFPTVLDTFTRIKDLWNGILGDNFVYRFRNSLEIRAYSTIDNKMCDTARAFENFIMQWVYNTAEIQITREVGKM